MPACYRTFHHEAVDSSGTSEVHGEDVRADDGEEAGSCQGWQRRFHDLWFEGKGLRRAVFHMQSQGAGLVMIVVLCFKVPQPLARVGRFVAFRPRNGKCVFASNRVESPRPAAFAT